MAESPAARVPGVQVAEIAAERSLLELTARAGSIVAAGVRYRERARSSNTLRAYGADWRDFTAWCATFGAVALPASPTLVALYITDLAERGRRYATIERRLAAIRYYHHRERHRFDSRDPHLRDTLLGIRNAHGVAQEPKVALLAAALRAAVDACDTTRILEVRDKAMLLVGFLGAFRRGELVALRRNDVRFTGEGMILRVRRSKTDQAGKGVRKAIPRNDDDQRYCAVAALRRWIDLAGLDARNPFETADEVAASGSRPLFCQMTHGGRVLRRNALSDRAVARTVQSALARAGIDPSNYSGHSLRSGFATTAALRGKSHRSIMRQLNHKKRETTDRYIQEANVFRKNAARGLL